MEIHKCELHTHRIMSGIRRVMFEGELFIIKAPSAFDKYMACLEYDKICHKLRFDQLLTKDQSTQVLRQSGTWTDQHEAQLEKYNKNLLKLKVDLYKNHKLFSRQKDIRKNIQRAKKGIENFLSIKHSLYMVTLEYHAELIKKQYLTSLCVYDKDDCRVFNDSSFLNSNGMLINYIISEEQNDNLLIEDYRKIVRNEPWKTIWTCGKENLFGKPACDWSEEQQALVSYSKMYDNVYQHPECPPDEVIKDDDMLDGWFELQKINREKENKKRGVDSHKVLPGGSQETLIMAQSLEDVKDIYDLNDPTSRHHVKEREQFIRNNEGKDIVDSQLPDVQMRINRELIQSAKRK